MATAAQWLGKLAHLKVAKARGDPAPHKPLFLSLPDIADDTIDAVPPRRVLLASYRWHVFVRK